LIRIFDRAVLYTGRTARAFALDDIPGLPRQRDPEISCLSFDTVNLRVRQDLDVGMPADLDQFGREYSDGAVIGRKGLVKLGHLAADGRGFVDQVNLETRSGKVQRGLNTADPSADNHHIAKMTPSNTLANTVCETFANLLFKLFEFFFHVLAPHCVSSFINMLSKKTFLTGCSKMPRCKAPEILRSETYFEVRRNDEG